MLKFHHSPKYALKSHQYTKSLSYLISSNAGGGGGGGSNAGGGGGGGGADLALCLLILATFSICFSLDSDPNSMRGGGGI